MQAVKEIADRLALSLQSPENTPDLDKPECAKCGDTGYFLDEQRKAHRCDCAIERGIRSRLPKLYWSARLGDFPGDLIAKVMAWLLAATSGLRLSGPVGIGKTHLAAAIVRHFEEQGKAVKFRTFSSVFRNLRECYSMNKSEREVLLELFTAPFLVLDDLGSGGLSDFERRSTLDILDERAMACLPTVVTTNWDLEEIARRMDDRIASRLSSFTVIAIGGRDHRPQKIGRELKNVRAAIHCLRQAGAERIDAGVHASRDEVPDCDQR